MSAVDDELIMAADALKSRLQALHGTPIVEALCELKITDKSKSPTAHSPYSNNALKALWRMAHVNQRMLPVLYGFDALSFWAKPGAIKTLYDENKLIEQCEEYLDEKRGVPKIVDETTYQAGLALQAFLKVWLESEKGRLILERANNLDAYRHKYLVNAVNLYNFKRPTFEEACNLESKWVNKRQTFIAQPFKEPVDLAAIDVIVQKSRESLNALVELTDIIEIKSPEVLKELEKAKFPKADSFALKKSMEEQTFPTLLAYQEAASRYAQFKTALETWSRQSPAEKNALFSELLAKRNACLAAMPYTGDPLIPERRWTRNIDAVLNDLNLAMTHLLATPEHLGHLSKKSLDEFYFGKDGVFSSHLKAGERMGHGSVAHLYFQRLHEFFQNEALPLEAIKPILADAPRGVMEESDIMALDELGKVFPSTPRGSESATPS